MFAVGLPDFSLGGGACKGSHGEDPLQARNASQVRGGEQGRRGTLGDGAGAFVRLSAIKEAGRAEKVAALPPPPSLN